MVLVTTGVISTVYTFYLEVKPSARNDQFLDWLKNERTAEWDAMTRADRLLTVRAVEMLRRGALADDREFLDRYQTTRHDKRFGISMIVAGAAIAVLILGTVILDWSW